MRHDKINRAGRVHVSWKDTEQANTLGKSVEDWMETRLEKRHNAK